MAVLKHIPVKNGNYQAAIDYLIYKHDELSGKMALDPDGNPIPREEFLMDGINCEPLSYPLAARAVNEAYGKNRLPGDVKTHHYILSFDPRDAEVGLTMEEAHAMAVRFAREWFGGHVGVVFTHPEGHNGAGNVHAHIAFCSVRSQDEPVRGWMTHESEWRAGGKHHATNKCHEELKRAVMDMCRARNLHQVDLLSPAKEKVTEREYWAKRRLAIREAADAGGNMESSDKRGVENVVHGEAGARASGASKSRYQTQKQQIRSAVRTASERAVDFESFAGILKSEHGISASMSRGRITYGHPERDRNITGRALGIDYEWPVIEANIRHRIEHGRMPARQSLISEIDDAIRAQGAAYKNKVAASNVRKLSETIAFLQEAGFESRGELDAAVELSTKALSNADDALKSKEAEIRRMGQAIRASGRYLSNRDAWRAYREAPDRRGFYVVHKRELEECNKARKTLSELFPGGKAPSLKEMRETKARLERERDALYERWCDERHRHREISIAKRNVDAALGGRMDRVAGMRRERGGPELE
ncbi:MAG: relaxase/mobilization nuclease domain-containing protein [Eggerthellaceae bacterium]|nr:relaxase/mobilization nuclease domain-containing protein [Eggerthellaceae bacterium]